MIKLKVLLIIFIPLTMLSQRECYQDIESKRIYNEATVEGKRQIDQKRIELENFTKNFNPDNFQRDPEDTEGLLIGTDYIIPVVVHVIGNNDGQGADRIDLAEVERAIELLNHFYAGDSAYDDLIDSSFTGTRGAFSNKKIKFVLANFDPSGNPTSGVEFITDNFYATRGERTQMRRNYNWPRANYFNIYVVDAFSNGSYSGFATFPFEVNNDPELDGHVMQFWAFGEQDACWETWYHNLAHEVGHWLNLYHIWSYLNQSCSADDGHSDTPNTDGNDYKDFDDFPGVGAITTCGSKDNITNMMDYTGPFYAMFSNQQRIKMEAALNSSVSQRNNLWTVANVQAKIFGCSSGEDSDNDNIPDACDECPNDPLNDSDGDGVCDSIDMCPGMADVDLDSFPGVPDACDPTYPIINFNTTTFTSYGGIQDAGVGDVYDNGSTIYVSNNGWKGIGLNYTVTANTVIEFDFKSSIEGEIHGIGFDQDNTLNSIKRYTLFGRDNTNNAEISTQYKDYSSLNEWKHYRIPLGPDFTGAFSRLFFIADSDERNNTSGYYNDGTSFFRNVKIYESNCPLSTKFESGAWNNGLPDRSMHVEIEEDYNTSDLLRTSFEACSCQVKNNATLTIDSGDYMRLEGAVAVASGSALIIKHQGSLIQLDDAATVINNGRINVELTTPFLVPRDFMLMGTPMSTETRAGVFENAHYVFEPTPADFLPDSNVPAAFGLNFAGVNNAQWTFYTSGPIEVGKGYLVKPQSSPTDGDKTYDLTYSRGTLNSGTITKSLDYNGVALNPTGTPNVLANPYPSAISASSLISQNSNIDAIYFWEHLTPVSNAAPGVNPENYSMGDISLRNISGGLAAANDLTGTATRPNNIVSTGQGFLVMATAASSSVEFNNSMRVISSNNTLRSESSLVYPQEVNNVWLQVKNDQYEMGGGALIAFNPLASSSNDLGYDSQRIATVVSLYSMNQDHTEQYGIQTRESFNTDMVIPLGFSTQIQDVTSYKISLSDFEGIDISTSEVYLKDLYNGVFVNLKEEDTYTFSSNVGDYKNRFELHFKAEGVLEIIENHFVDTTIILFPNPAKNEIEINSPIYLIETIKIVDLHGRLVYQSLDNLSINKHKTNISKLSSGIYMVSIITESGTSIRKLIKK